MKTNERTRQVPSEVVEPCVKKTPIEKVGQGSTLQSRERGVCGLACVADQRDVNFVGGAVSSTAVRVSPVWRDPEAILELIRSAGPFWPLANYAASDAEMAALGRQGGAFTPPWFRQDFARQGEVLVPGAEAILENPHFAEAAARLGGGANSVVRPQAVYVNLMGPTPFSFPPHLDVPAFRGFTRSTQPIWLLKIMKTSGLFEGWRTKIATAVSWFYGGPGGDFLYWPDGPEGSMSVERAPYENVAVLADNEATFHGVTALGGEDATIPSGLNRQSRLVRGSGGWEVLREDQTVAASFSDEEVRVTVSWKADVFESEDDAMLHDRGDEVLTLDRVVEILAQDLAARGASQRLPLDPLSDQEWISILAAEYRDPAPAMP